jgi:hypothetical protein
LEHKHVRRLLPIRRIELGQIPRHTGGNGGNGGDAGKAGTVGNAGTPGTGNPNGATSLPGTAGNDGADGTDGSSVNDLSGATSSGSVTIDHHMYEFDPKSLSPANVTLSSAGNKFTYEVDKYGQAPAARCNGRSY